MQAIGSGHTLKTGSLNTSSMKVNSLKSESSVRQISNVEEEKLSNAQGSKTPSCVASSKALNSSCKLSKDDCCCVCGPESEAPPPSLTVESSGFKREEVEQLLKENEEKLRKDFEEQMEREINNLKDKFDMILHNEQVRASLMLCEAHRERKEKIRALETQLESKNLTGLMYVLCSERRKSKIEKLRLTQEYTSYILALQGILAEAQSLILRLSRGYKTATRLDQEWRDKMKSVVKEFQNFVCHYEGGPPDMHQYLFDVPQLMHVQATTEDDMLEDPCGEDVEMEGEAEEEEDDEDQVWYKRLDKEGRPFVVYGDLADFKPPDRREVLKKLKAANADEKRVPKKWKEYVFNDMFIKAACPNINAIKDEYLESLPTDKWECQMARNTPELLTSNESSHHRMQSLASVRGNAMGSILKIISSAADKRPSTKTMLLGARDSMEIASSTKILKEKRQSIKDHDPAKVVLDVKNRRTSIFQDISEDDSTSSDNTNPPENEQIEEIADQESEKPLVGERKRRSARRRTVAHDSISLKRPHHSRHDGTINYEKVCPVKDCQKLKVDSFIRSLPPYMRASPYMHFEQTFDDYEICSPEQLEMLIRRIAEKKLPQTGRVTPQEDVLEEWVAEVPGIATQTGEDEEGGSADLPPCTCRDPTADEAELQGMIYNPSGFEPGASRIGGAGTPSRAQTPREVGGEDEEGGSADLPPCTCRDPTTDEAELQGMILADLFPVKHTLDHIEQECLHNENINFNRFKVLGQTSDTTLRRETSCGNKNDVKFKENRLEEIKKILLKYPDLMDIFQSSPKC